MRALAFIITLLLINTSYGANDSILKVLQGKENLKIYQFEILEEIAPAATRTTSKAMDEAEAMGVDLIILRLNTYGGLVSDADSIRTRLLNSKIPVFVFVENNAASAGALISIACHRIYMREGASIGAATVVTGQGEAAPDKYQSYFRSKMRATASARGRNPEVAQAMVDGDKVVPGLNDTGDVVTLTAAEAVEWGFCEGITDGIPQLLKSEGLGNYSIVRLRLTWIDQMIGFLISPGVSGFLILLILGGIYYEIRTPGIGFPILVSVIAALLYFAPLYLEGLAANWEILLFLLGLVLLGLEIFVIPGFGVAGISGLVLLFAALVLSAVNNIAFDFSPTQSGDLQVVLLRTVISLFAFILLIFTTGKALIDSKLFRRLSLEASLESGSGEKVSEVSIIGSTGIADTALNPQGVIEVDGEYYEATALSGYIDKGQSVRVLSRSGKYYKVESI